RYGRLGNVEAMGIVETHARSRDALAKSYGERAVEGYSPYDGSNPINISSNNAKAKIAEAGKNGTKPQLSKHELASLRFTESPITKEMSFIKERDGLLDNKSADTSNMSGLDKAATEDFQQRTKEIAKSNGRTEPAPDDYHQAAEEVASAKIG